VSNNFVRSLALCVAVIFCATAYGQPPVPKASPAPAQPEVPPDVFGRMTPRGTVLGFLKAARSGDNDAAAQYLNTRLRGNAASDLAHQLFFVLDRRLPARLNELSDRPEGSLIFPTRPDEDLVGAISSGDGTVDILVERVSPNKKPPVWLFSRKTLDSIPDLYEEIDEVPVENLLPGFLVHTRIAQIALFEWLAVFVGLPLLYLLTSLLSRALSPWTGRLRRSLRKNPSLPDPVVLPKPVRLLVMVLVIRWMLAKIALPLLARQFWSGVAAVLAVAAFAWLLILLNGGGERLLRRRLARANNTGAASILRLGRRTLDLLLVFSATLVVLHYFGVNITAALAGLGVGGIAVALAAQKTLENVIGGISIIFDQVVKEGDMLNTGNTMGVIEDIGLRSTRIRTLDRTLVSVPNGQIANLQLENFSARDKFWFHPNISLPYETTTVTLRSIIGNIDKLLARHAQVDTGSARVRLLQFGPSSFSIEVFAYVLARDFPNFLEIQQELLLQVMEIVEAAGSRIALQSQTVYLATDPTVSETRSHHAVNDSFDVKKR
jgi:MscS family membrane protein